MYNWNNQDFGYQCPKPPRCSRSDNVTISNHYNGRSCGLGLPGNEESTKVSRIGEMSTDLSPSAAATSRRLYTQTCGEDVR
jgi:hypothetical protein